MAGKEGRPASKQWEDRKKKNKNTNEEKIKVNTI